MRKLGLVILALCGCSAADAADLLPPGTVAVSVDTVTLLRVYLSDRGPIPTELLNALGDALKRPKTVCPGERPGPPDMPNHVSPAN